jgi:DNA-binding response OmpR family regulator
MLEGAGLRVDRDARRTYVGSREIELTSKEFDLLALLMSRPGVTFTREQIMNQVWDEHWWGSTRTLDTHVSTLRKKIGDDSDPPAIVVTIRGVGFRFQG